MKEKKDKTSGIQKWRDELPKDAQGKPIYPKREKYNPSKRLIEKKKKLDVLMVKVNKLKSQIIKLEKSVNKGELENLLKGYTLDELKAKLAK